VDLPVEHAVLLVLYSFGAIAAGCLFSNIFTTVTGVCVALFYAVVLTMVATGNAGVALEVAEVGTCLCDALQLKASMMDVSNLP